MTYYAKSMFYPVLDDSHSKILRYSSSLIRSRSFLIDDRLVFSLPDGELPQGVPIVLLDQDEHVLTINSSNKNVQFSVNYKDIAEDCYRSGWLGI